MEADKLSYIEGTGIVVPTNLKDDINDDTKEVKHTVLGTIRAKEPSGADELAFANQRKELADLIMRLPDKIMALRKKKLELEFSVLEINRSIKRVESEIIQVIQAEADANGKKKFSNETMRKAELYNRTASDTTMLTLKSELERTMNLLKNLDIEIEHENNRFKAARRVVDLVTTLEG